VVASDAAADAAAEEVCCCCRSASACIVNSHWGLTPAHASAAVGPTSASGASRCNFVHAGSTGSNFVNNFVHAGSGKPVASCAIGCQSLALPPAQLSAPCGTHNHTGVVYDTTDAAFLKQEGLFESGGALPRPPRGDAAPGSPAGSSVGGSPAGTPASSPAAPVRFNTLSQHSARRARC
jgi:hypothetical protein